MPSRPEDPGRRILPEHAALAALFAALAFLTWRRWPDLLIDFGQQLYIPWRLSAGERLHRDILFLHGPLSQHLNGALFRTFGVSLTVLIIANLCVLAGLTLLIHRIVLRATDRATAAVAGALFLGLFGFAQYVYVGNYNYIAPYAHEATHGIALALAMLLLLCCWIQQGRTAHAVLAGLCLGGALLTKVDVAVAALLTAGVAAALHAAIGRPGAGRSRDMALAGLTVLTPVAGFFLYFLTYLPMREAFSAATTGFASGLGEVTANPFYRHVLGLDNLRGNISMMLRMAGWVAGVVCAAVGADFAVGRLTRQPARWAAGSGVVLAAALIVMPAAVPWLELPRALPLATLAAIGLLLVLFLKARRRPEAAARVAPLLLLSALGFFLAIKAGLNLHLYHYGFYLAMPATVALAALLLHTLPALLRERGLPGGMFRALMAALGLAGLVYHLRFTAELAALKDFRVGRGGDAILTYGPGVSKEGAVTAEALRYIEERTPPAATLVALPEGIMLNYQARRASSATVINYGMGEAIRFGEAPLVDSLRRRPPDFIALVHRRTDEFGVGPFGVDPRYGRRLLEWIEPRYVTAATFGAEPFAGEPFGIRILERRRGSADEESGP